MTPKIDKWIIFSLFGLSCFGIFNLAGIRPDLILQQIIFFIGGLFAFFLFYKIGSGPIRANIFIIYAVLVAMLIFVSFLSPAVRGSSRWIDLYFFKLQPSELLRPFFLSLLVHVFARKHRKHSGGEFFKVLLLSAIPIGLILHQPDLGNAILYILILMSTLYYVGINMKFFAFIVASGVVAMPILWNLMHQYQRLRIIGFLNPEADPQGISYNLLQSIIAVGSGGVWGKGLGLGTQSRFQFLPEFHTDFAFASLVEQFGFFGGFMVLTFYGVLIFRLIVLAIAKKDNLYAFLFLFGVATIMFASVIVNVGMNIGLLPVTGVALPFISYGGSSVLSTFILLGMAMAL